MKTVDARGQMCPRPLIMMKQALNESLPGEKVRILIDNIVSRDNVEKFLVDNGMAPARGEENGILTMDVENRDERPPKLDVAACCPPVARPHVIVFSSNGMGQGSDELGEVLIKGLVNIIIETAPLPSHLIFYNSGIFLTVEGSTLVNSLRDLENRGVEMLVCGTCVQHFDKKDAVRVGTISNMYKILETMTAAGHIIKP